MVNAVDTWNLDNNRINVLDANQVSVRHISSGDYNLVINTYD